jgi:hypothetical protein
MLGEDLFVVAAEGEDDAEGILTVRSFDFQVVAGAEIGFPHYQVLHCSLLPQKKKKNQGGGKSNDGDGKYTS